MGPRSSLILGLFYGFIDLHQSLIATDSDLI